MPARNQGRSTPGQRQAVPGASRRLKANACQLRPDAFATERFLLRVDVFGGHKVRRITGSASVTGFSAFEGKRLPANSLTLARLPVVFVDRADMVGLKPTLRRFDDGAEMVGLKTHPTFGCGADG